MILLTGATGTVGSVLLRRLTATGRPVRCLVRDPRRLGPERVRVQIALGDLGDPGSFRHALRGVETVVHLAASIRDQPGGSLEELNAMATLRLAQGAAQAGVGHFVLFSAIGASDHHRARFFRAKALAERAVRQSGLPHTILRPSLVYAPGDPWLRLVERLALLPVVPIPGRGRARFQPIWAEDVADATLALLDGRAPDDRTVYELAGPETLTHEAAVGLIVRAAGHRPRPIVPVPQEVVRRLLEAVELAMGPAAFATSEEAELLDVPMTTPTGTADAEALGVAPQRMPAVLGVLGG